MIDTAQAPNGEESAEQPISLEEVQAILTKHFGPHGHTLRKNEAINILEVKFSGEISPESSVYGDSEAVNAAHFLRELAGKCLACADELNEAEGYDSGFEFYARNPAVRTIGVVGLDDEVDICIANANSDEEAIVKAQQAFHLLGSKRQIRRPTPPARNPGQIRLETIKTGIFEFVPEGIFGSSLEGCRITVNSESNRGSAERQAMAFIQWLQAQAQPAQADTPRMTA